MQEVIDLLRLPRCNVSNDPFNFIGSTSGLGDCSSIEIVFVCIQPPFSEIAVDVGFFDGMGRPLGILPVVQSSQRGVSRPLPYVDQTAAQGGASLLLGQSP